MAVRYFLIFGLCMGTASCKKGVEPEPVNYYPMSTGNNWTYTGLDSEYNYRPTIPGTAHVNSSSHWIHHVSVVGLRTLPDSTRAWQFKSVESTPGYSATADQYYRLEHDTLKFVAYWGSSEVFPKRSPQIAYIFRGQRFGTIAELIAPFRQDMPVPDYAQSGIVLLENPSRVLLFPLKADKMWSYNTVGPSLFPVWKKVVGTETVSTPAGSFFCYKIQWMRDIDNDAAWDSYIQQFDFVCAKGMIKRMLIVKDITITGPGDPEGSGMIDITSVQTVTSINFHDPNE
jgi:hypothetical protein